MQARSPCCRRRNPIENDYDDDDDCACVVLLLYTRIRFGSAVLVENIDYDDLLNVNFIAVCHVRWDYIIIALRVVSVQINFERSKQRIKIKDFRRFQMRIKSIFDLKFEYEATPVNEFKRCCCVAVDLLRAEDAKNSERRMRGIVISFIKLRRVYWIGYWVQSNTSCTISMEIMIPKFKFLSVAFIEVNRQTLSWVIVFDDTDANATSLEQISKTLETNLSTICRIFKRLRFEWMAWLTDKRILSKINCRRLCLCFTYFAWMCVRIQ